METEKVTEENEASMWRGEAIPVPFPRIAYYGILAGFDLKIVVAFPLDEDDGDVAPSHPSASSENKLLPHDPERLPARWSLRRAAAYLSHLKNSVSLAARAYGRSYVFTSRSLHPPSRAASSVAAGEKDSTAEAVGAFSYISFIEVLVSLRHQFLQQVSLAASRDHEPESCGDEMRMAALVSFHTMHFHLASHPVYKELLMLLSIEEGRLCVCVSCSATPVQRLLTKEAAESGVDLLWVNGAALVLDPLRSASATTGASGAASPALALLDILMNLDLAAVVGQPRLKGAPLATLTPDAMRSELECEQLRGVDVMIISSLPFEGATACATPLHLYSERACVDNAVIPTPGEAPGSRSIDPRDRGAVLRCTLSLRTARSSRFIVPQYLLALTAHLVDCIPVQKFSLLPFGPVDPDVVPVSALAVTAPSPAAAVDAVGGSIQYLLSKNQRHDMVRRGGPSMQLGTAFTRLSADAWLTHQEQLLYGLVEDTGNAALGSEDDDADGIQYECEFFPVEISFERQPQAGTPQELQAHGRGGVERWRSKRFRSDDALRGTTDEFTAVVAAGGHDVATRRDGAAPVGWTPCAWGPRFYIRNRVLAVIEDPTLDAAE